MTDALTSTGTSDTGPVPTTPHLCRTATPAFDGVATIKMYSHGSTAPPPVVEAAGQGECDNCGFSVMRLYKLTRMSMKQLIPGENKNVWGDGTISEF